MARNKIFLAVGVVVAVAVGFFFFFKEKSFSVDFEKLLLTYPQHSEYILHAQTAQERLEKDPSRIESYVSAGMAYKALGDIIDDGVYYAYARDLYDKAIELTDWNNTVLTLNAGAMSELLKEYDRAEEYYKGAIEHTGGDPAGYQRLANLYRIYMKKPSEQVLWVYDEGLRKLVFPGGVLYDKAAYLTELGRYKEALELYEQAKKVNPSPKLEDLVKELEQKIKNN